MKIISLNTFNGVVFEPCMKFIQTQASTTDIFCLQEVISGPFAPRIVAPNGMHIQFLQEISRSLPDFSVHFAPMANDLATGVPSYPGESTFGLVTMIKKDLVCSARESFFICNDFNAYVPGDFSSFGHVSLYTQVQFPDGPFNIMNVHGTACPIDKLDSNLRLEQSHKILSFTEAHPGRWAILGDFNLCPNTESIRMIEHAGFRNLITEYGITTTRGSNIRKLFPEYKQGPYGFQEFADYTFVSPDITVKSFSVPDTPISDHLPMMLEI